MERSRKEIIINNYNGCNNIKVKKNLWDLGSDECKGITHDQSNLLDLLSWPPRSYTCSFCKREFRSAQALGGHMNVHRRDRARLRQWQSPQRDLFPHSLLNLNLDPNPSLSSYDPSTKCPLIPPTISTISATPPTTVNEMRKWGKADGAVQLSHSSSPVINQDLLKSNNRATKRRFKVHEKDGGLLKNFRLEAKEDLDLELRLGYT
ncbi:hypothetical protein ACH5RR_031453 [Cinchona calisaya]|uniref:C2H2-type domain-containing protein n=1 Tax=Cinchona calisaya TaxID=153742 RepID=A0ABD2YGN1_9GENT